MHRRGFLKACLAAAAAPYVVTAAGVLMPVRNVVTIGVDLAAGRDFTAAGIVARMQPFHRVLNEYLKEVENRIIFDILMTGESRATYVDHRKMWCLAIERARVLLA
jgi:hypothetical protein